jgi:hypothetical protein
VSARSDVTTRLSMHQLPALCTASIAQRLSKNPFNGNDYLLQSLSNFDSVEAVSPLLLIAHHFFLNYLQCLPMAFSRNKADSKFCQLTIPPSAERLWQNSSSLLTAPFLVSEFCETCFPGCRFLSAVCLGPVLDPDRVKFVRHFRGHKVSSMTSRRKSRVRTGHSHRSLVRMARRILSQRERSIHPSSGKPRSSIVAISFPGVGGPA